MRSTFFLLALVGSVFQAWAIWVPAVPPKSSPDYQSFQREGVWFAPGYSASDSLYKWVDIPDVGRTILPPIARPSAGPAAPSTDQPATGENAVMEAKAAEENKAVQRDATFPRFNDVTADVEYGMISLKPKLINPPTYKGFCISAKARYERQLNENSGYGARIDNEYTKYEKVYSREVPGNDFLLIGGFYRHYIGQAIEVGGQLNWSFFFRTIQSYSGGKDSMTKTDWAANPMFYGIYNYSLPMAFSCCGPITGYAGGFAGYTYYTFSYSPNQISYAGIGSIGTTFGQNVAAQADVALSHEFLVMGIQVPVYLSRLFSITPGFKYPLVFKATNLHVLRITIGASTRF